MAIGIVILSAINLLAWNEMDAGDPSKQAESPKTANIEAVISRPKVEYQPEGLRDPFEPLIKNQEVVVVNQDTQKTLPALTVQGVIWGSSLPQAIINNKVVKVGDSLEGVDIVSIGKDGVTISFNGVESTLSTITAMGQQDLLNNKGGSNEKKT